MHYYKRNLGDYAKKAGRLSMLQHGSYTLLIDACYDREQFPTLEEAVEWTWASTTEEREAVAFVLHKFFVLEDGLYVQKRIQEELADYQAKADKNKQIAIDRETLRKENGTNRARTVNAASGSGDEPPPNHKPLTTNHIKEKKSAVAPIPRPDDVSEQIWGDWLQLRKAKRAAVSLTVLDEARAESLKAGLPLERFLAVWCARGSQGLQAEWLKPHERAGSGPQNTSKYAGAAKAIWGDNDSRTIDA